TVSGDACTALQGKQPGNYTFHVRGTGITRVELHFKDRQSTDPNMAIHRPFGLICETGCTLSANPDSATTMQSTPVDINVIANDVNDNNTPLNVHSYDQTSANGGIVTCTNQVCSYVPASGFTGTDTFSYTACDPYRLCNISTVSVIVGDNPPDAIDDSATTS